LNGCILDGSSRGLTVKYAEDQHKKREMTRLQNLTSHNVYRYTSPDAPPHMSVGMGMLQQHQQYPHQQHQQQHMMMPPQGLHGPHSAALGPSGGGGGYHSGGMKGYDRVGGSNNGSNNIRLSSSVPQSNMPPYPMQQQQFERDNNRNLRGSEVNSYYDQYPQQQQAPQYLQQQNQHSLQQQPFSGGGGGRTGSNGFPSASMGSAGPFAAAPSAGVERGSPFPGGASLPSSAATLSGGQGFNSALSTHDPTGSAQPQRAPTNHDRAMSIRGGGGNDSGNRNATHAMYNQQQQLGVQMQSNSLSQAQYAVQLPHHKSNSSNIASFNGADSSGNSSGVGLNRMSSDMSSSNIGRSQPYYQPDLRIQTGYPQQQQQDVLPAYGANGWYGSSVMSPTHLQQQLQMQPLQVGMGRSAQVGGGAGLVPGLMVHIPQAPPVGGVGVGPLQQQQQSGVGPGIDANNMNQFNAGGVGVNSIPPPVSPLSTFNNMTMAMGMGMGVSVYNNNMYNQSGNRSPLNSAHSAGGPGGGYHSYSPKNSNRSPKNSHGGGGYIRSARSSYNMTQQQQQQHSGSYYNVPGAYSTDSAEAGGAAAVAAAAAVADDLPTPVAASSKASANSLKDSPPTQPAADHAGLSPKQVPLPASAAPSTAAPALGSPTGSSNKHAGASITLRIDNLPRHADVGYLQELFAPYGRILSAQIDLAIENVPDSSSVDAGDDSSPSGDAIAAGAAAASAGPGRVSVCSGSGCVQVVGMVAAEEAVRAVNQAAIIGVGDKAIEVINHFLLFYFVFVPSSRQYFLLIFLF
jgi:hypothetical protein